MATDVIIPARLQGPPGIGNGGYVAGVLAGFLGGAADVALRRPAPLDTMLSVEASADSVSLTQNGNLLARAEPAGIEMSVPALPSLAEAVEAASHYPGLVAHHFPGCFVCGPARTAGDGMRIFSGKVEGREIYAAPWQLPPDLADRTGNVPAEYVWAALDCPGYFPCFEGRATTPALLARMTAQVLMPVAAAQTLMSISWKIGGSGRRHTGAAAVVTAEGEVCAVAETQWVEVSPDKLPV